MAKVSKFKFSKLLKEPADVQPIKDYLRAYSVEAERRAASTKALEEQFADLLDHLRSKHRIPRDLTILIDPNHLNEHGFVIVHSQEADMHEIADDGPRTLQ